MRRLMISCFLISVLGLVSAGRVGADTFTWQLPSSLTIAPANYSTGVYFDVLDVPYSENGVPRARASLSSILTRLLTTSEDSLWLTAAWTRFLSMHLARNFTAARKVHQRLCRVPTY